MSLLLLLGGAPPATSTAPALSVYLVDETRTKRWPVYNWRTLKVELGKHCTGTASVQAFFDLPWVWQMQDEGDHPFDRYSLDVYYRDTETPLFSGPLRTIERSHDGTESGAKVEATFETFFQHFFRRRVAQRENMAEIKAVSALTLADQSVFYVMAGALADPLGSAVYGSDVVHTDGATNRDRTEWGPSWVVTMENPAPTFAASAVDFEFAGGSPSLDLIVDTCERGGCTVTITETSPAHWEISTAAVYELTDRSDRMVLSPKWGTTGALKWRRSTDAKSNAWTVFAGEAGGVKLYSRLCDGPDVDARGTYEDFISTGGGTDTDLATAKGRAVEVHTPEAEAVDLRCIEVAGITRLNVDFFHRDTIRIYDDIFQEDRVAAVVGLKLEADERADVDIDLRLMQSMPTLGQRLRHALPQPGGRNAGGLEVPKFWK